MKIKNKSIVMIVVSMALILLIGGYFYFFSKKTVQTTKEPEVTPVEDIIPTVDSSVKVDLASSSKKEALLSIDNIPNDTVIIEYSLSYETKQQGLQGVIGTISLDNEQKYEKKITLGTCSSGSCVYHEVLGSIKLSLKFTGDYGERLFEKDFTL